MFRIYLTQYPSFREVQLKPELKYHNVTIDLDKVTLVEPPLVSERDIIEYDWSFHRVVVSKGVGDRFPRPNSFGTPFVVVANGQRCYLGGIWTSVSSVGTHLPIIDEMDARDDCFEIQLGYPGRWDTLQDPREDSRIYKTLKQLGKLKCTQ